MALWRHSDLRLVTAVAAAALLLGAALGGADVLYGHRVLGSGHSCPYTATRYECFYHPRPGWVGPTALGIILLGLAGAAGVLVAARRTDRE